MDGIDEDELERWRLEEKKNPKKFFIVGPMKEYLDYVWNEKLNPLCTFQCDTQEEALNDLKRCEAAGEEATILDITKITK